jgi:hypothetical protein
VDRLFSIYLTMMIIGWGVFIGWFLLGLEHHHFLHGDIGNFGHSLDSFLSHHGIALSHGHDELTSIVNPINFRNAPAFAGGFGLGGTFAMANGASLVVSILWSSFTGLLVTVITWGFTIFVYSQRASALTTNEDYLLVLGQVTITIPKAGMGEIAAVVHGQHKNLPAISLTGEEILRGKDVETRDYKEGVVYVVLEGTPLAAPEDLKALQGRE